MNHKTLRKNGPLVCTYIARAHTGSSVVYTTSVHTDIYHIKCGVQERLVMSFVESREISVFSAGRPPPIQQLSRGDCCFCTGRGMEVALLWQVPFLECQGSSCNDAFRFSVQKFHGFRCGHCGRKQRSSFPGEKRPVPGLEIHHTPYPTESCAYNLGSLWCSTSDDPDIQRCWIQRFCRLWAEADAKLLCTTCHQSIFYPRC